jgi:hypothetical protein
MPRRPQEQYVDIVVAALSAAYGPRYEGGFAPVTAAMERWACQKCGSVVVDKESHGRWHREMAVVSSTTY